MMQLIKGKNYYISSNNMHDELGNKAYRRALSFQALSFSHPH